MFGNGSKGFGDPSVLSINFSTPPLYNSFNLLSSGMHRTWKLAYFLSMNTFNVAIKKYGSVTQKPLGIPNDWVAEVVELGQGTTLPDQSGAWILMTNVELQAYLAAHIAAYNAWAAVFYAAAERFERNKERVENLMDFGRDIIIAFRVYTLGITDEFVSSSLLMDLQPVFDALSLGALELAKDLLMKNSSHLLDVPYDPAAPDCSQTLRKVFIDKILVGVQSL
jgi:hypothetical protein